MADLPEPKKDDRWAPYQPEPWLDAVGRPEVTKGLFGDLFKRKRKSRDKDQKSETRA